MFNTTCQSGVSFVVATHNRCSVLAETLWKLREAADGGFDYEIIVVDNDSTDETVRLVETSHPDVQLVRAPQNLGSCAKALGVDRASRQYVVFLDDDSYPRPGSIERMVDAFETHERLGAIGFEVHLPDGSRESGALPHVFVGCGVGFRREALLEAGGLDRTLFMQAEEYDLAFRLAQAGWNIRLIEGLAVEHLKTPQSRLGRRTIYYDTRNNLILTARYLPDRYETIYRQDWSQRYQWIAAINGHSSSYWRARLDAYRRRRRDRLAFTRWRLSEAHFEQFFRLSEVRSHMQSLVTRGVRSIVLAEMGKNIYAFVQGAREAGLNINAIADDRFFAAAHQYRGVPLQSVEAALESRPDAVVISNMSPAHAQRAHDALANRAEIPVYRWYGWDTPPVQAAGATPDTNWLTAAS